MSWAARKRSWLTALAVVAGALAAGPAAGADYKSVGQAEGTDVVVSDNAFSPPTSTATVGERVWFQLADDAQKKHYLAFDNRSGVAIVKYMPDNPKYQRNYFAHSRPGEYAYYCLFHGGPGGQGMSGVLKIVEPVRTTTSTMRPATTTTARSAPATTSTKPSAVTAPRSTSQPGVVSGASKPTATTTTAPLPALPSLAAGLPTFPAVETEIPMVGASDAGEAALGRDGGGGGSGSDRTLIIVIGLAVALLVAGGWDWYRSHY